MAKSPSSCGYSVAKQSLLQNSHQRARERSIGRSSLRRFSTSSSRNCPTSSGSVPYAIAGVPPPSSPIHRLCCPGLSKGTQMTQNPQALLSLYSMYYGEIKIRREMLLKGANHRYMLYFNCEHLNNPLTWREIFLPPLDLSWCKLLCFQSDSPRAGDFVAIYGFIDHHSVLACCRIGDGKWMPVVQSNANLSCQPTYYNGMFYVHDLETKVTQILILQLLVLCIRYHLRSIRQLILGASISLLSHVENFWGLFVYMERVCLKMI